jgi:hypothetical protein
MVSDKSESDKTESDQRRKFASLGRYHRLSVSFELPSAKILAKNGQKCHEIARNGKNGKKLSFFTQNILVHTGAYMYLWYKTITTRVLKKIVHILWPKIFNQSLICS